MLSNTVLSVWNFLPTLLFAFQICTFPLSQLKYFRLWNFLLWCGLKTYLHRSQLISLTHTNEPMGSRTYLTAAAKSSSVVSDSVRPHRGQPTRLPCPWDSPGKNTGVGCHFLLKVKKWSHSVVSDSSRPHGLQPTRLLHPWDFPGKSTGVRCYCLLQWELLRQCNSKRRSKMLPSIM